MRPLLFARRILVALLCLAGSLYAQDSSEFARNFPPELSFTETYADEVKSATEDGWTDYWAAPDATSKFKVTAKVSAQGMDLSAFNGDTIFSFAVGDFSVSGVLGDDPKYVPGAASIRIPLIAYDEVKDKDYEAGAVVISWTPTTITVTAQSGAPETYSILSSNYLNANVAIDDTTSCSLELDDRMLDRTVYFRGMATTQTKEVGRGDFATEVDLNTVKLTGEIDSIAPKVAITSPVEGAVTGDSQVTIAGSVSDEHQVAGVLVQINGELAMPAVVTGSAWSLPGVPLILGANTIRVTAVDLDGNEATASRTVNLWTPLTVGVTGSGTVLGGFLGTTLREQGAMVTLRAKANPGAIFAGWTGSVTSSQASVSFIVAPGMDVVANFIPLPFGELDGRYSGLIHSSTGEAAGTVRVQLTEDGRFTAQAVIDGKKAKLKGAFDATGRYTGTLSRKGLTPLVFDLTLDTSNGSEAISGTITDGANDFTLTSDRAIYGSANPCPQEGVYTALLRVKAETPGAPEGDGWLNVKIRKDGTVKTTGMLADGTAISSGSTVLKNGRVPLFFRSKAARTVVGGTVAFGPEPAAENDFSGVLYWDKEARAGVNITAELEVHGVAYDPAQARVLELSDTRENAEITLTGGGLATEVRELISIFPNGQVTARPHAGLKLTLKPAAGTFAGSFRQRGSKPVKFRGVVLQKHLNRGVGVTLGKNAAGSVTIAPATGE